MNIKIIWIQMCQLYTVLNLTTYILRNPKSANYEVIFQYKQLITLITELQPDIEKSQNVFLCLPAPYV